MQHMWSCCTIKYNNENRCCFKLLFPHSIRNTWRNTETNAWSWTWKPDYRMFLSWKVFGTRVCNRSVCHVGVCSSAVFMYKYVKPQETSTVNTHYYIFVILNILRIHVVYVPQKYAHVYKALSECIYIVCTSRRSVV